MRGVDWPQASKPSKENAAEMLAASTASKKGSSSDGGIMRLMRKPVCRTAHTTSSRMGPWWQPHPDVPKEAMRSNSAAWATRCRPNASVIHLG
eukprot:jgi/Tetstr1/444282/TSEL_032173.t1